MGTMKQILIEIERSPVLSLLLHKIHQLEKEVKQMQIEYEGGYPKEDKVD